MTNKALFLDRDGVINIDHGYVHKIEDFSFIEGIFSLVRLARSKGYIVIVITNQAGIARGYYSESVFLELTKWMCNQFKAQDALIDKVYFSPYHPDHGLGSYKKDDLSRKPHPGMLFQAMRDFDIDLQSSVLIGDNITDIEAGFSAGVGTKIYFGNDGLSKDECLGSHLNISYLSEAAKHL